VNFPYGIKNWAFPAEPDASALRGVGSNVAILQKFLPLSINCKSDVTYMNIEIILNLYSVLLIDTSHVRLLLGCFLLYTDYVAYELVDSTALLLSNTCGGGDK
jgi:hypothetical protein